MAVAAPIQPGTAGFLEAGAGEGQFSSWSVSGHAVSIEYSIPVLEQIRADAVDGFHRLRHGGIEIGGFLFGTREGDRIRIVKSREFRCEYAHGPSFALSQNDEAALDKLIQEAKSDQALNGLEPVGWYHSHTRSGVFLSKQDLEVYRRHFPERWQIALVLRPTQLGPAEAGFFFREPDGTVHSESSYNPFTISPLPKVRKPSPAAELVAHPEIVCRPEIVSRPEVVSIARRSFAGLAKLPSQKPPERKWLWLVAAAVLAFLGIGIMTGIFHISGFHSNPATLNLRASDRDGWVHIEWERSAEPLIAAEKATLLVVDGDHKLETTLSPELLHNGSLVYQRRSTDVEIRLRINGADPVQELTRLIGLPPVTAAPAERSEAANGPPTAAPAERSEAADRTLPAQAAGTKVKWVEKGTRAASVSRIPGKPAPAPFEAAPSRGKAVERGAELVLEPPPVHERASAVTPASLPWVAPAPPQLPPVYRGPTTGRIIWTGNLPAHTALAIEGGRASIGDITGKLPPAPMKISAYPADFSRGGMQVFAPELPKGTEVSEEPGPENGWTKTVYKRNAKRAGDIAVTESPSARNNWKRIALRAGDRGVSVIVIDWQVLKGER